MAVFQADQNVRVQLIEELRWLGHTVYRPGEDGAPAAHAADSVVLSVAAQTRRVMLTGDRRDFARLHRSWPDHAGIVTVSFDRDDRAVARRIHQALQDHAPLGGRLVRILRPTGRTTVES